MPKKTGKYDINFRLQMLEKVRKVLAAEDYILNSTEYVNNRTKLDITCPRGHKWYAGWDAIRANKRCKQCYEAGIEKARLTKKRKPKGWAEHREQMYVKFSQELVAEGYEIQTDRYSNNWTKVPVKCSRGHDWSVRWCAWSRGERCRFCWIEDSRLSNKQVAELLAANGCELLSEYLGVDAPLKYRCECGNISFTSLKRWKQGHRCSRCAGDKVRKTLRLKRVEKLKHRFDDCQNSADNIDQGGQELELAEDDVLLSSR